MNTHIADTQHTIYEHTALVPCGGPRMRGRSARLLAGKVYSHQLQNAGVAPSTPPHPYRHQRRQLHMLHFYGRAEGAVLQVPCHNLFSCCSIFMEEAMWHTRSEGEQAPFAGTATNERAYDAHTHQRAAAHPGASGLTASCCRPCGAGTRWREATWPQYQPPPVVAAAAAPALLRAAPWA